ncbi:MAG: hypothetical protein ABW110_14600 [Steroidobacteraceae bacterium]
MSNRSRDRGRANGLDVSEITWKGAQAFKQLHALNERCLERLIQLACSDREKIDLMVVQQHRNLWRNLSASARKRAADVPFLLVDMHFQDATWWRSAKDPRLKRQPVCDSAFLGPSAGELMRETLMLAWSLVARDRASATILLGMTPAVGEVVADLDARDVERISARHSRQLQPRWSDFPAFWGRLLAAAHSDNEDALHLIRLHGLQLLGRGLIPLLDSERS